MRYFDFDSIPASTMIRHEFEDASRWTIVPYFSNTQKCVELIWTPSTVIYNYLKHCHNNLIEHNVRDAMFRLYKPKEYRQKLDIAFNDNYSISLNWTPYKAKQLTHSDVNNSIGANELTAQFIHLTLYIPFLSGLCYTKGSYQWHHKDRSKRYRLYTGKLS